MIITLNQSDLEAAIRSHIRNLGIVAEASSINFTAGRSPQGITAEIELGEVAPAAEAPKGVTEKPAVAKVEVVTPETTPQKTEDEKPAPKAGKEVREEEVPDEIPAGKKKLFSNG